MKQVPVPGMGTLTVPDDASPDQIEAAIAKVKASMAPPPAAETPAPAAINPNLGSELLGNERPKIDVSPEAAGAPPPPSAILSAIMGFGRSVPGSDIMAAGTNALVKKIKGSDRDFSDLYGREKNRVKRIAGELKEASPIATLIGQVVGSGAQYAGGMGAVKAIAPKMISSLLGKVAAGAVVNPIVTAAGGEKPGVMDAAFGAGGELLGPGLKALAKSEKLMSMPKAIVSSVIRPFMKSLPEKEQVDLAKEILFRNVKGSPEKIRAWADEGRKIVFGELDKAIAPKASLPIKKTHVSDALDPLIKNLEQEPATFGTAGKIKEMLTQFYKGKPVTVGEAQAQKISLQARAKGAYKSLDKGGDATDMADYFMGKASGLRKAIEEQVPEAGPLNKEAGTLKMIKEIFSQLEKKEAGKSAQIGLKDLTAGGLGAVMMGGGGAAGAPVAARVLQSPKMKLLIANLLKNSIQGLEGAGTKVENYLPPAASAIAQRFKD